MDTEMTLEELQEAIIKIVRETDDMELLQKMYDILNKDNGDFE